MSATFLVMAACLGVGQPPDEQNEAIREIIKRVVQHGGKIERQSTVSVDLSHCQDVDWAMVNDVTQLLARELNLSFSDVEDSSLGGLRYKRHLEELTLWGTSVTDAGLEHLAYVPNLRSLRIGKSAIKGTGLAHLKYLPLTRLDLVESQMSVEGLQCIKYFPCLRELDLRDTGADDSVAEEIGKLSRLDDLRLSGTKISDAGVAKLGGLQWLDNLELDQTKITDKCIESLSGLKRIQTLELSRTSITDAGVRRLSELRKPLPPVVPLKVLVDRTQVTEKTLAEFQDPESWFRVDVLYESNSIPDSQPDRPGESSGKQGDE